MLETVREQTRALEEQKQGLILQLEREKAKLAAIESRMGNSTGNVNVPEEETDEDDDQADANEVEPEAGSR